MEELTMKLGRSAMVLVLATFLTWASNAAAASTRSTFQLIANPTFLSCLSGSGTPSATVTVVKGKLNDTLTIKLRHVKPKIDIRSIYCGEQSLSL
jgi:hypothetical protein